MILLLMRRASPRIRAIAGATLVAVGVALIAQTVAVTASIPVHAIIVTMIGGILLANGIRDTRRARNAR